jgi:hypothetical protein
MLKESCVKVTNISKISRVCRHLDDLLLSISSRIGPIMYMHTYRRSSHSNNTTSCFIQLENWNKHALLTEILNQLDFHGTLLRAEESTFNFQFDDNEYVPRSIGCSLCINAVSNKTDQTSPQSSRYFNTQTNSNTSPPPYDIHTPTYSTQKRKLSTINYDVGTSQNKQHKSHHLQTEYIPIESDNSNDSNYSIIKTQPKSEPTTFNLPKSLSNIQIDTSTNNSPTEPQPIPPTNITTTSSQIKPTQTPTSFSTPLEPLLSSNTQLIITRCSTCQIELTAIYFKPLIAQTHIFDKKCPHQYCTTCFDTLTTTNHNSQCSWDDYPMVGKIYRKRYNADQIYTCQLCQLFQYEKL